MELFLDVLGESLVDTAKMLPFLFLAYLLIEYIEHRHGERIEALLAGGASAVVGYVNNVYSVYSRSMLWATVNRMLEGDTVQQAVDFGLDLYGSDDIVWYNAQGGRRPHAVASYPIICGQQNAKLPALETAELQQAA